MLDAFRYLLCSKLCQHNRRVPNPKCHDQPFHQVLYAPPSIKKHFKCVSSFVSFSSPQVFFKYSFCTFTCLSNSSLSRHTVVYKHTFTSIIGFVNQVIKHTGEICYMSFNFLASVALHRFQILPILQIPSTTVKCIHKYKYRYRYMEILCTVQSQFNLSVDYFKSHFNWYMEIHVNGRYNTQTTELVLV